MHERKGHTTDSQPEAKNAVLAVLSKVLLQQICKVVLVKLKIFSITIQIEIIVLHKW